MFSMLSKNLNEKYVASRKIPWVVCLNFYHDYVLGLLLPGAIWLQRTMTLNTPFHSMEMDTCLWTSFQIFEISEVNDEGSLF